MRVVAIKPTSCAGCAGPLPERRGAGRHPKWCSEPCRKRTMYGGTCIDCGGPTNGSDGRGPNAPKRCHSCGQRNTTVILKARYSVELREHRDRLAAMYLSGASLWEIAEAFGWTSRGTVASALWKLRNHHGYDLPHRYAGWDKKAAA